MFSFSSGIKITTTERPNATDWSYQTDQTNFGLFILQ